MSELKIRPIKGAQFPEIHIPYEVYADIQKIVQLSTDEIGWIGTVRQEGFNFIIEKVTVPKQGVHATTTEIDGEGLVQIMDEEPEFDLSAFRYWGHSHVNMGVTPSGQDMETLESFVESCDWFIASIHNKKDEIFGYMINKKTGYIYTGVPVHVLYPEPEESRDWEAVIKERVTKIGWGGKTNWGKNWGNQHLPAKNRNLPPLPQTKRQKKRHEEVLNQILDDYFKSKGTLMIDERNGIISYGNRPVYYGSLFALTQRYYEKEQLAAISYFCDLLLAPEEYYD